MNKLDSNASQATAASPSQGQGVAGLAYHWKSHALLPGVVVSGLDPKAIRADTADRFDIRAATVDPINNRLSVEVWMNNGPETISNFNFSSQTSGADEANFISSLDLSEWTLAVNDTDPNRLIVAGHVKDALKGQPGSVKLGTIEFAKAAPSKVPPSPTSSAFLALNLDARLPILPSFKGVVGGYIVENVLDAEYPETFSHLLEFPLYDKLGLEHTLSLYFRRVAADSYNIYINVDGQVFASAFDDNLITITMRSAFDFDESDFDFDEPEGPGPKPVASFRFVEGKLASVGAAIQDVDLARESSDEIGNLTLKFAIYPSAEKPLDPSLVLADPVQFELNFDNTTMFASAFEVKSFEQDGHAVGASISSAIRIPDTGGSIKDPNLPIPPQQTTGAFVDLNLDTRLPIVPTSKILAGEPEPVSNVLDVDDPDTFSHLLEFPLYDKVGLEHTLSLFFRRVAANFYNLYVNVDGQVFAASAESGKITIDMPSKAAASTEASDTDQKPEGPKPVASFGFFEGKLVQVGAAIEEGSKPEALSKNPGNLSLAFVINPPAEEPLDPALLLTDRIEFALDFYQTTLHASAFNVKKLEQDGHPFGGKAPFSSSDIALRESSMMALNLDARLPIVPTSKILAGELGTVSNVLDVDDPDTFSHLLEFPLYDKLGLEHTLSLYFRRVAGNFYNLYVNVDGQVFASTFDNNKITIQMPSKVEETEGGDGDTELTAPTPVASFGFFEGRLVSVGAAITEGSEPPELSQVGNLTLEFQIDPPEGKPLDPALVLADPFQFKLNFYGTTNFAAPLWVMDFDHVGCSDLDESSLIFTPVEIGHSNAVEVNLDARFPIISP